MTKDVSVEFWDLVDAVNRNCHDDLLDTPEFELFCELVHADSSYTMDEESVVPWTIASRSLPLSTSGIHFDQRARAYTFADVNALVYGMRELLAASSCDRHREAQVTRCIERIHTSLEVQLQGERLEQAFPSGA